MELMSYLSNIVICIFEIYILNDLFQFAFEIKPERRRIRLTASILLGMSILGLNYFRIPLLNILGGILLATIYGKIIFNAKIWGILIYSILFYIIGSSGEVIGDILYSIIYHDHGNIGNAFSYQLFLIMLIDKVIVFSILKLIQYISKKIKNEPVSGMLGGFLVLPLSTLFVLYGIIKFDFFEDMLLVQKVVLTIGCTLLLFSNVFVYHLIERFSTVMKQRNDQEIINTKAIAEKNHYTVLEKINQEQRRFSHDITKTLGTITQLIQGNENEKVIELLEKQKIEIYDIQKMQYCYDSILNGLLGDRIGNAQKLAIDVEIKIDQTINFDFIDDLDKISIIGNLLDNAIEAAAKCAEQRKIIVDIYMGSPTYLVIQMKNTFRDMPVMFKGDFVTSKSDKQKHGIGIKRVKELARKYGGMFSTMIEDEMFIVDIFLSLEK